MMILYLGITSAIQDNESNDTNECKRKTFIMAMFPLTTSNDKEERATSDSKVKSHYGALFKVPSHKPWPQHRIAPRGS